MAFSSNQFAKRGATPTAGGSSSSSRPRFGSAPSGVGMTSTGMTASNMTSTGMVIPSGISSTGVSSATTGQFRTQAIVGGSSSNSSYVPGSAHLDDVTMTSTGMIDPGMTGISASGMTSTGMTSTGMLIPSGMASAGMTSTSPAAFPTQQATVGGSSSSSSSFVPSMSSTMPSNSMPSSSSNSVMPTRMPATATTTTMAPGIGMAQGTTSTALATTAQSGSGLAVSSYNGNVSMSSYIDPSTHDPSALHQVISILSVRGIHIHPHRAGEILSAAMALERGMIYNPMSQQQQSMSPTAGGGSSSSSSSSGFITQQNPNQGAIVPVQPPQHLIPRPISRADAIFQSFLMQDLRLNIDAGAVGYSGGRGGSVGGSVAMGGSSSSSSSSSTAVVGIGNNTNNRNRNPLGLLPPDIGERTMFDGNTNPIPPQNDLGGFGGAFPNSNPPPPNSGPPFLYLLQTLDSALISVPVKKRNPKIIPKKRTRKFVFTDGKTSCFGLEKDNLPDELGTSGCKFLLVVGGANGGNGGMGMGGRHTPMQMGSDGNIRPLHGGGIQPIRIRHGLLMLHPANIIILAAPTWQGDGDDADDDDDGGSKGGGKNKRGDGGYGGGGKGGGGGTNNKRPRGAIQDDDFLVDDGEAEDDLLGDPGPGAPARGKRPRAKAKAGGGGGRKRKQK